MALQVQFRSAAPVDAPFISEMARHACVIEDWSLPDVDSEEVQELLPRAGDVALVATDETDELAGAVWMFQHDAGLILDHNDTSLPEIAIAVAPKVRGRGLGGALLDELFVVATGRYEALSLNVHQRNPAIRLYQRKGFRPVGQGRGQLGVAMRKDL
jgi:ribosomal protein S18 acetylase RimI-like enzyme